MTVRCYKCHRRVRVRSKGSTSCPSCRVVVAMWVKGKLVEVK
jgi:hypothetical protein